MADKIHLLYVTFPDKKSALLVAGKLVEQRLIACANVAEGITSVFRWEGKVQQEPEVSMIAKTTDGKLTAAMAAIKAQHPYDVPCIVSFPIGQGHAPFLEWVKAETA